MSFLYLSNSNFTFRLTLLSISDYNFCSFSDYWVDHPDTQEFIDLQIKYRKKRGAIAEDSESDSSSPEGEQEQGTELSEDENEKEPELRATRHSKSSLVSRNKFALLEDD